MFSRELRNREYLMRAAWPFVISWANIGLWATAFQSICSSQRPGSSRSNSKSPRCPYIFEVLLLQYGKEEPGHDIVIIGRHDDNVNGECSDRSVEGPTKEEREDLPTVEEKGLWSNLSFTAYW